MPLKTPCPATPVIQFRRYPSNQEGETRSLLFAESDKAQQRQEHVVWPSLKFLLVDIGSEFN